MCRHNSLLPSVRTGPRRTVSVERTCFRPFSRRTSRSSPTPMNRSMPLPADVSAWIASRRWSKTLFHVATILKVSPASSAPTLNVERNSSVPSVAKAFISALPVHRSERNSKAEYMANDLLLRLPHRLVTLSMPKMLRVFFKHDRKLFSEVSKLIFDAATLSTSLSVISHK